MELLRDVSVQIHRFSNNATMTVASADCWWRLVPAVRLQLATGPAVPEHGAPPSVKRAVARLGLIQDLRDCSSRWRTLTVCLNLHLSRHQLTKCEYSGAGTEQRDLATERSLN